MKQLKIWKYKTKSAWKEWFDLCIAFEIDANTLISKRTIYKTKDIGMWIGCQLDKYKKNTLSEDKLTYLKQLNTFVDRILDKWTPWLELCKDYEKNDLILYSTICKGKPIGTWLSQQLTSYKQKKMSDDRFQRLKQINAWNDKFINKLQIKWNKKYNLCAEFEKTNTLIKGTVNYKNEPIGSWFQEQRKSHNKGKLKEDRLKKLKQLKTWAHRSRKK